MLEYTDQKPVPGLVVHPPTSPQTAQPASYPPKVSHELDAIASTSAPADPTNTPPASHNASSFLAHRRSVSGAPPVTPPQLSHAVPQKPPLQRSHSDIADHQHHSVPYEQITIYKSYTRSLPDGGFDAFVRGWLFHPHLNRKGKLMVAAVERLVGNPGKYTSIADAAAAHVADNMGSVSLGGTPASSPPPEDGLSQATTPSLSRVGSQESMASFGHSHSLGTLTASTVAALTSRLRAEAEISGPQPAAAPSPPASSHSPSNSAAQAPTTPSLSPRRLSFRPVMFRSKSKSMSAPGSPVPSEPSSAATSPHIQCTEPADAVPPMSLKRPGFKRNATFDGHSRAHQTPKQLSAAHMARKGQKHTIRERMAAISHKSLAARDVKLVIESAPNADGRTTKRTFWTVTDESGRFSIDCVASFRPDKVKVCYSKIAQSASLLYVPPSGVSVISDVDDTVRHTGVTKSKRELLQNVLAKSFDECGLEGVAEWYQKMAAAGANFHYVSNSPWQLYDVVCGFLHHHNFPEGSIHLKKYAGVLDGLTEPAKGRKKASLEKILNDFPDQKFIFIGDSGEADLEAYADIAKRFPRQVLAIYIRDISLAQDEPLSVHDRKTQHRSHHSLDVGIHSFDAESAKPDFELRPLKELHPTGGPPSETPSETPSEPTGEPTDEVPSDSPELRSDSSSSSSYSLQASPSADSSPLQRVRGGSQETLSAEPRRPKMLRRTSSKIKDSISSMASSTSQIASRLLTSQQSVRPTRSASGRDTAAAAAATTPRAVRSLRHANTYGSSTNLSGAGSPHARTPPELRRSHSEVDLNQVFVPSNQEINDFERLDRRSESWKARVHKQQNLLPVSVALKMYRSPTDIESESLRTINRVAGKSE